LLARPRGGCPTAGRAIIAPRRARLAGRATLEGRPIDIIFLVERLESLVANGRRLPLTNNVVIDQEAALALIDELRAAVPEEIRQARRINEEGERILERARSEAEAILTRAQEQAAFLIDERGLTQAAAEEGRRIIARAEAEAAEIRRGADEYAASTLVALEGELVRTLESVRKGIAVLDARGARAAAAPEPDLGEAESEEIPERPAAARP
jgi:hypothetical protein